MRSSRKPNRTVVAAQAVLAGLTLLCAASAFAQGGPMSPYQDEKDGVSAGGKWMEFQSEDKMTGAKKVRFELVADSYFRADPNYQPRVDLFCEDGKLKLADFTPAGLNLDQVRHACDLTPKKPSKD